MQFDEVLRTWRDFFERERIRYAVIGGLAMQAWGRSRFTKDADFAVDRNAQPQVVTHDIAMPVASPEHLAMMKVIAIKNNPPRAAFEGEDIRLLTTLPGFDSEIVRDYFERHGMLEMWNAIKGAR